MNTPTPSAEVVKELTDAIPGATAPYNILLAQAVITIAKLQQQLPSEMTKRDILTALFGDTFNFGSETMRKAKEKTAAIDAPEPKPLAWIGGYVRNTLMAGKCVEGTITPHQVFENDFCLYEGPAPAKLIPARWEAARIEREACAKLCDEMEYQGNGYACAAAIRARGQADTTGRPAP